jgi:hypothetical protein
VLSIRLTLPACAQFCQNSYPELVLKMIASDDTPTPAADFAAEARGEYPLFKWAIVLALALGCASPLASASLQSFALVQRLTDFPVRRNFYPVDAIQFMADRQLEGKLVVSFNWAQYAIAALAPDVKVAFDGSRVLRFGSPDLVLLDRRYEESVAVMRTEADKENPEWVLMYHDRWFDFEGIER